MPAVPVYPPYPYPPRMYPARTRGTRRQITMNGKVSYVFYFFIHFKYSSICTFTSIFFSSSRRRPRKKIGNQLRVWVRVSIYIYFILSWIRCFGYTEYFTKLPTGGIRGRSIWVQRVAVLFGFWKIIFLVMLSIICHSLKIFFASPNCLIIFIEKKYLILCIIK
jgi:hypothetical protein